MLKHVKVLDLTRLLPGAFCTFLLSELGAHVLKIEELPVGDYMRLAPPLINGVSIGHLLLNKNKKSLTLNLKTQAGRRIFYALVKQADIVLEGYRPGVAQRLRVDYTSVKRQNPQIIYCSITAYGQTGPLRDKPGHDVNITALTGLLTLLGGKEPHIPEVQVADLAGGMYAAIAILAALVARAHTKRGRYLDVSMADGMLAWLWLQVGQHLLTQRTGETEENVLAGTRPFYDLYTTKDGQQVALAAIEPHFWETLCKTLQREDFLEHQWATGDKQQEVLETLRRTFQTKTRREWLRLLSDVCLTPVLSAAEALEHPAFRKRDTIYETQDRAGRLLHFHAPIRAHPPLRKGFASAPTTGEHTDEILKGLGYRKTEITALRAAGVV